MTTTAFDSSPLPPRRTQWIRAARAFARILRKDYDSAAIQEFAVALDGGDGERSFQSFLSTKEAARLVAELPDLAGFLDDHERLAELPPGSLGRTFLELAQRDGIRVRDLVEGARRLPDYESLLPDEVRRWYAGRGVASHDLLHILTGYERSEPGELLLIAFSLPRSPFRIFRISLVLSVLTTPKRQWLAFVRDLRRAYARGRAASVSPGIPWEELLPLPIDEVRRRLGIAPLASVHPQGLWQPCAGRGGWERVAVAAA